MIGFERKGDCFRPVLAYMGPKLFAVMMSVHGERPNRRFKSLEGEVDECSVAYRAQGLGEQLRQRIKSGAGPCGEHHANKVGA